MQLQIEYEEFLDQYDQDIYIGSTSQESYTTFLDLYYNFCKNKNHMIRIQLLLYIYVL